MPDAHSAESPHDYPGWFEQFIDDRQVRKLSPHSLKAYRQDFAAIAALIAGHAEELAIDDITKSSVRTAFAMYARDHSPASIRRCWSTWNVLCTFLFTAELLESNPMALVGRPKLPKTLPKALPESAVESLLGAIVDPGIQRRVTDWPERDLAIVLTGLLAGLRAEELRGSDVGDIRTNTDGSGVIYVRGKGGKHRHVPVESSYLDAVRVYLQTRALRIPLQHKKVNSDPLRWWAASAPLFVGRDGKRISRGTLQSRIARAFKLAGPDAQPIAGALAHGLRHTFATELANADVNIYTLMKLLGHESMTTSQRYVAAAGAESRSAAATNPLYRFAEGAIDPSSPLGW
ncbi:tyrosine-type recombinase/integrase [Gordonia bronchialis]|uniref:tyrosine-type recombinase/integrase n=1 Tax=Gordonia bronchialis TaxID=2054 RepID=UPI001CBFC084|nr:tyrosine-type recombinase/integrase [Gordonia bronchialis]UAK39192.1 tyrosine-type recombinase/integrase [Gordonia bronchialis]